MCNIIKDEEKLNKYIKNVNQVLKKAEINEKITRNTTIDRIKQLLNQVKLLYRTRKEIRPTTTATAQSTPPTAAQSTPPATAAQSTTLSKSAKKRLKEKEKKQGGK